MYKIFKHSLVLLLLLCNVVLLAQEPEFERHFEDDFKSRYSGRKFDYEGDVEVKKGLKVNDGEFAEYEDTSPKEKEESDSSFNSVTGSFLNFIFITILILAVIFIIYNVMNEGQTGFFNRGKLRKLKTKEINVSNIEDTDIETLISSAENEQNYRLAIRYYYLLVLKTLSLKNVIKYEDDKTDSDYLNEIGQQAYINSFSKTSYLYNHVWYGEFSLNQKQYYKAKGSFETLLKTVSR